MSLFEVSSCDGARCPVCSAETELLDVMDFNKTCLRIEGPVSKLSGKPVYYSICNDCEFAFAPELHGWSRAEFAEKIYNQDYGLVDPDYLDKRPRANAQFLPKMFPNASGIGHLDYGGGEGKLSALLRSGGWTSASYDPLIDGDYGRPRQQFDLVTAFEVFEHVPSVTTLMDDLSALTHDQSVIVFTTQVSDGQIRRGERLSWWYASPRNGHISLYSRKSLGLIANRHGFAFGSFNDNLHLFYRPTVPAWARHIVKPS